MESWLKQNEVPCAVREINVENVSEMRIVNSVSGRMIEQTGSSCGRYIYDVVDKIGLSIFSFSNFPTFKCLGTYTAL